MPFWNVCQMPQDNATSTKTPEAAVVDSVSLIPLLATTHSLVHLHDRIRSEVEEQLITVDDEQQRGSKAAKRRIKPQNHFAIVADCLFRELGQPIAVSIASVSTSFSSSPLATTPPLHVVPASSVPSLVRFLSARNQQQRRVDGADDVRDFSSDFVASALTRAVDVQQPSQMLERRNMRWVVAPFDVFDAVAARQEAPLVLSNSSCRVRLVGYKNHASLARCERLCIRVEAPVGQTQTASAEDDRLLGNFIAPLFLGGDKRRGGNDAEGGMLVREGDCFLLSGLFSIDQPATRDRERGGSVDRMTTRVIVSQTTPPTSPLSRDLVCLVTASTVVVLDIVAPPPPSLLPSSQGIPIFYGDGVADNEARVRAVAATAERLREVSEQRQLGQHFHYTQPQPALPSVPPTVLPLVAPQPPQRQQQQHPAPVYQQFDQPQQQQQQPVVHRPVVMAIPLKPNNLEQPLPQPQTTETAEPQLFRNRKTTTSWGRPPQGEEEQHEPEKEERFVAQIRKVSPPNVSTQNVRLRPLPSNVRFFDASPSPQRQQAEVGETTRAFQMPSAPPETATTSQPSLSLTRSSPPVFANEEQPKEGSQPNNNTNSGENPTTTTTTTSLVDTVRRELCTLIARWEVETSEWVDDASPPSVADECLGSYLINADTRGSRQQDEEEDDPSPSSSPSSPSSSSMTALRRLHASLGHVKEDCAALAACFRTLVAAHNDVRSFLLHGGPATHCKRGCVLVVCQVPQKHSNQNDKQDDDKKERNYSQHHVSLGSVAASLQLRGVSATSLWRADATGNVYATFPDGNRPRALQLAIEGHLGVPVKEGEERKRLLEFSVIIPQHSVLDDLLRVRSFEHHRTRLLVERLQTQVLLPPLSQRLASLERYRALLRDAFSPLLQRASTRQNKNKQNSSEAAASTRTSRGSHLLFPDAPSSSSFLPLSLRDVVNGDGRFATDAAIRSLQQMLLHQRRRQQHEEQRHNGDGGDEEAEQIEASLELLANSVHAEEREWYGRIMGAIHQRRNAQAEEGETGAETSGLVSSSSPRRQEHNGDSDDARHEQQQEEHEHQQEEVELQQLYALALQHHVAPEQQPTRFIVDFFNGFLFNSLLSQVLELCAQPPALAQRYLDVSRCAGGIDVLSPTAFSQYNSRSAFAVSDVVTDYKHRDGGDHLSLSLRNGISHRHLSNDDEQFRLRQLQRQRQRLQRHVRDDAGGSDEKERHEDYRSVSPPLSSRFQPATTTTNAFASSFSSPSSQAAVASAAVAAAYPFENTTTPNEILSAHYTSGWNSTREEEVPVAIQQQQLQRERHQQDVLEEQEREAFHDLVKDAASLFPFVEV